jgi:hypothetical protein
MLMVFSCALCAMVNGRSRIDGVGKFTIKDANLVAVKALLAVKHPESNEHVECLTAEKILCLDCFPEDLRQQVTRLRNKKRTVGTFLVGQAATVWADPFMKHGKVISLAPGGMHVVEWDLPDGTTESTTLSEDETKSACRLAAWLKADSLAKEHAAAHRVEDRIRRKTARQRAALERGDEVEPEDELEVEADEVTDELTDAEVRSIRRSLSRYNLFNTQWWASQNKMGVKLHRRLFGFDSPGQMRHFWDVAFRWTRGDPSIYGLGPYEQMALAIYKMRSGNAWMEIEADMGALKGKGNLTRFLTEWCHRLGAYAKNSLVGVPEAEYMTECIPQIYRDCNMEDSFAIGDGTVFLTETPRRGIFKQLKNQLWNDKTHHAGALGESLCSPHGMNIIAADLFTGRTSEVNALRELIEEFKKVPAHKAFTYDKGAKALRCILPNGNHLYMPCFLAPAKGKSTFTGTESSANKAIARCRYVVEITYTRVKDWKILAGEIPRENFHLLNSAW